jgi:mono/diheme cytochrome c family protein
MTHIPFLLSEGLFNKVFIQYIMVPCSSQSREGIKSAGKGTVRSPGKSDTFFGIDPIWTNGKEALMKTKGIALLIVLALLFLLNELAQAPSPGGGGIAALRAAEAKAGFSPVSVIFDQRCIMCHTGGRAPAGLRLDSYEKVMAGSRMGPVVVPGKPGESELVLRIQGKRKPAMPLNQPTLPETEIETIVRWIEQGAPE